MQSLYVKRIWSIKFKAILGMVIGSSLIIGTMLYLHSLKPEPPKEKDKRALSFEVVKNVKTPEKPKPKPKPKPRPKQSNVPPPAPIMASLGVGLSGIDFGVGGYDVSSDVAVDETLLGDTSNAVMTGETVDQKPRAIKRPPLKYPARAMAKQIEGFVMLSVLIDEQGNVADVKVIESDPPGTFDQAAIQNIKKWKFEPARYDGKAVSLWVNQPISFEVG